MTPTKAMLAGLAISMAGLSGAVAAPLDARTVVRTGPGDPVAAVKAALAADAHGEDGLAALPKTPRLIALLRPDGAALTQEEEQEPALDYNFLTGAQEPAEVSSVVVTGRVSGADRMTVVATFTVFGDRARRLTSRWLRGAGGRWLLDDMSDGETTLTRVLSRGPRDRPE